MTGNLDRRAGFDQKALAYSAVRPRYTKIVFDTIEQITNLSRDAKLLEIGPGTGQATQYFAQRGYDITGIELGPRLARIAKEELKNFPEVRIIVSDFESVNLEENSFDLIYSATAFHWIDPKVKFSKTYKLLKPGGFLAIIHTKHISDETGDELSNSTQYIYDKYIPPLYKTKFKLPKSKELQQDDIDQKYFKTIYFNTFLQTITYSSDQFAQLLSTYSPHIAMEQEARRKFLKEIKDLIDRKFNGKATKHYGITLTIAQKQ